MKKFKIKKISRHQFSILPFFIIFLLFTHSVSFPIKLNAQTPLPEQDKYVLKPYMVIPWGEGRGKLTLKLGQEKIHPPSSITPKWALKENSAFFNATVTIQYAPPTFKLDDEGNVYIPDYLGKQPVLKKFDPKGNEIASTKINPAINPTNLFWIQGDKIVVKNEKAHEVEYLSRGDLSVLKKFSIPKEFDMTYLRELNGVLYKPVSMEPNKLSAFVLDDEERKKSPAAGNDYLYHFSDGKHIGLNKGQTEILNLSSKVEEWTTEDIFHWNSEYQDKFGNIFLTATTDKENRDAMDWDEKTKGIYETTIFKTDKSGLLLLILKIKLPTLGELDPGIDTMAFVFDENGNIYYCWGGKDGFHIDEYQYLNEKE